MSLPTSSQYPGQEIPALPYYPPLEGSVDQTWQLIYNVAGFSIMLGFIVFALYKCRQTRSPIPILFLAGGSLCIFIEPIIDVMAQVWFYRDGQWVLFEAFGRPMPTFLLASYTWYMGGQALLTWLWMEKGVSSRQLWKLYWIFVLVDIVLEEPILYTGIYTYYGDNQPLKPGMLPLWWPIINATIPLVMAAVIHCLKPFLSGWRVLAVVVLVPMSDALTNAAAGFPVWTAISSSRDLFWTNAGAIATCALCQLLVWIVTRAAALDAHVGLATRSPTLASA
jgi:hypothetical protein